MAANDIYPLSTPSGAAIPLDIVRPASLVMFDFTAGAVSDIVLSSEFTTCWLYATEDCILRLTNTLPAALVSGTVYDRTIFVPASSPISVLLEAGNAAILGLSANGKLYINSITQWAALAQQRQIQYG